MSRIWLWFDCEQILNRPQITPNDLVNPNDYEYDPHRNGYWVKSNSATATWLALKEIPHFVGTRPYETHI